MISLQCGSELIKKLTIYLKVENNNVQQKIDKLKISLRFVLKQFYPCNQRTIKKQMLKNLASNI